MRLFACLSLWLLPVCLAADEPMRHVHDPTIATHGGEYYVFSTGKGIPIRRSKNLLHWETAGRVFEEDAPAWARQEIPGARDVWAPDISFCGGQYHLYYSVSTFGSQRSCIGLATNKTLDPADKEYQWIDQGKVIESFPGKDDFNAIDPALVLDARKRPWLVFGSFWGNPTCQRGRQHVPCWKRAASEEAPGHRERAEWRCENRLAADGRHPRTPNRGR